MNDRSTLTQPIKFTYEDYLHFSEDKRYEIIDGEVYMVPSPVTYHQKVGRNLFLNLWDFVKENQLGEVLSAPLDVVLSDIDVVQPDILFVSKERQSIITDKNIQGAPDLVVEILSPSSTYKDRVLKNKLYSKYGVKEFWLVDPDKREIQILILKENILTPLKTFRQNEILQSHLLNGLAIRLTEIF